MATARPLTSTSFAILGLLSLRSWTTYELAQQMQRALGQFWPRAESKIYEEPKKLVEHGLARAIEDRVGNRPRTIYSITAAGRQALHDWMPTPSEGPVIEFEGMIKVFFAEHGTKADLVEAIESAHRWVDRRFEESAGISQAYLDGDGAFPERLPWLLLAGRFLEEMMVAVERWADWASDVVEGWPDDLAEAEADWAVLEAMADHTTRRRPRPAPDLAPGPWPGN